MKWDRLDLGLNIESFKTECSEFLKYSQLLVKRGYISNTLGNIALIVESSLLPNGYGILTKKKGVSLEEIEFEDLIITSLDSKSIYYGDTPPSSGHLLNQKILTKGVDKKIRCAIHSHPDKVISLYTQLALEDFPYISSDAAIV